MSNRFFQYAAEILTRAHTLELSPAFNRVTVNYLLFISISINRPFTLSENVYVNHKKDRQMKTASLEPTAFELIADICIAKRVECSQ